MADLSPDQQQAVERLKETTIGEWMARGLKFAAAERLVEDLRLLLAALDELTTELSNQRAGMAAVVNFDARVVAELIADRDAQRARADAAERERDEANDFLGRTQALVREHQAAADTATTIISTLTAQFAAAEAGRARLLEAVQRFEGIGHVRECKLGIAEQQCDETGTHACEGVECDCGWAELEAIITPPPAPEGKE